MTFPLRKLDMSKTANSDSQMLASPSLKHMTRLLPNSGWPNLKSRALGLVSFCPSGCHFRPANDRYLVDWGASHAPDTRPALTVQRSAR